MASKGQKFNKYSNDLKLEILGKYLEGNCSYQSLSIQYNIPKDTIKTWVYQHKLGNDITKDDRGNPKNQEEDYKEKYEILKNYQAFIKAQREKK